MNTKQENLEIVRQACIKANPAIMELGFGCKFISENGSEYTILHAPENTPFRLTAVILEEPNNEMDFRKDGKFEILGRPIRLADVLLAMGKNKIDVGCSSSFKGDYLHMFPQGNSKKEEPIANTHISVDTRQAQWNLLKDDLRDQFEETITFLAGLFK